MHVHAEHQTYTAPSLDPAKQWLPPAPHSSVVSWFRRKNWRWHKSCTLLRQPKNAKPLSGEGPLLVWNAMPERGCTASQWACMGLSLHMVDDCMNTTNSIFAKDWHQYHFRGLKIGHALVDASFKFHQQVIKSLMIDSLRVWRLNKLPSSSIFRILILKSCLVRHRPKELRPFGSSFPMSLEKNMPRRLSGISWLVWNLPPFYCPIEALRYE